jgi:hypothetical protein
MTPTHMIDFCSDPAIAGKEAGLDGVEVNNQSWVLNARRVAEGICREKGEVSTDDLRPILPAPAHPNSWGAVFRAPWVCKGWRRSSVKSNHARMIRVWSLL